jgi:hypothetical protein
MLPALIPYQRTSTKRIVIYASGMSGIFFAALLFGFHGRLQTPRSELTERGRHASSQVRSQLIANYGKLPLSFELNQGQADAGVKFFSRGRGYGLFLTSSEALLEVRESGAGFSRSPVMRNLRRTTDNGPRATFRSETRKRRVEDAVIRLRLVGAKPDAEVSGREGLPGKVNYFIGNDPKLWRTNVPTYAKVAYRDVYPGIDLVYYGNQGGELEYDFIVAPGADPSAIALAVGAVREPPVRIDAAGDLVIAAQDGEIRFHKPAIYQEQSTVQSPQLTVQNGTRKPKAINRQSTVVHRQFREGHFSLDAQNRVHFALGPYDHTKTLVIDPVLSYSTYLGGSGSDASYGIAVDGAGNAYVTGLTVSTDFPTVNPLQGTNISPTFGIAFVSKINAVGSALVYSTYLGGSGATPPTPGVAPEGPGAGGQGIAVDAAGDAYVTGITNSTDFPTVNPLQATNKAAPQYTAFVAKLNPAGNALVYSTYLGGSISDAANSIAADSSGAAYVGGSTSSSDFPTVQPLQATNKATEYETAFVAKLNPSGSALVYSTYLGGSTRETGNGIAVDSSGNAYVSGGTWSTDFPTVNPLQASNNSQYGTGFVAELNPAGSALVYSTYLGGSGATTDYGGVGDEAFGIAADAAGNAYVTGITVSTDFPTFNPWQPTNKSTSGFPYPVSNRVPTPEIPCSAFVAKLSTGGSAFVYSTYLGGSGGNAGYSIATDIAGNSYVTGATSSTDFPTANPVQTNNAWGAFVAKLNPTGSALIYSSQLGGGGEDLGLGIAVDSNGNAYVTGSTESHSFPTVNPLQATNNVYDYSLSDCVLHVLCFSTGFVAMFAASPADAVLSALRLSFGGVLINTSSPVKSVNLIDGGDATMNISSITASGDFALATTATSCPYGGGMLAPAAVCTIDVTFTPLTTGSSTGTVMVATNGSGSPETIDLSGTGLAPTPNLSPATLSFASQLVGTASSPQNVTVTNAASVALTVSSLAITSGWTEGSDCIRAIPAGGSCKINVSFQPVTGGAQSGALTVADDAVGGPQTVALSGTALAPVVNLSATSLTFPAQTVSSQSAPQTITLTNTGNGALTPLKVSRTGDFAQTNTCGNSVAVGASCTISVTFSPVGAGTQSGTITLTDNAADSPQTIQLSGTGIDFAISSSTPSQTVSPGQVANYSLTLAPQNGFDQKVNLVCTGAPSESTCTLTPNTVTLNGTASGTVAVAVSTTAASLAPPQGRFLPPGFTGLGRVFWLYALLWLATSVLALAVARRRLSVWLLGAGLVIVMLWSACGGGGTTTPPPTNPGTPAGTYTVDVTATDASTSTLTHTIQLTLTVN